MKLSAKLPPDDQGAKLMRFENVRGRRYTEIFLIGGHAITYHLVCGIYNTIGMNDPAGTGDTCPPAVLDQVLRGRCQGPIRVMRSRGTFTGTCRPAVASAVDAVPEAYHNPAAVWWGPLHLPPTCRLPYLSAALATAGACAWRAAAGAEDGIAPACTAWVA